LWRADQGPTARRRSIGQENVACLTTPTPCMVATRPALLGAPRRRARRQIEGAGNSRLEIWLRPIGHR
jgi:hypothetical protein